MASRTSESLKKIEEQITCSVCLEFYNEPKLLLCNHVYCKSCLEMMLAKSPQQHPPTLHCPSCRKPTHVPEGGISGLAPAFYINNLFEVRSTLVSAEPTGLEDVDSPQPSSSFEPKETPSIAMGRPSFCLVHNSNELELFCENCQDAICFKCTLGRHRTHNYNLVSEVSKKYKEELSLVLMPIENEIADAEKGLARVNSRFKDVLDLRDSIEESIFQVFEESQQVLNTRRTALINKLHDLTQEHLKTLATERDLKETLHAQLCGSAELLKGALNAESDMEMLKTKNNIVKIAEEASREIKNSSDLLTVETDTDIHFKMPPNFTKTLEKVGEISGPDTPHPLACTASGTGMKWAMVGKPSVIIMEANTDKGLPYQKPIKSLKAELVYQGTGTTFRCNVKKGDLNQHEVYYTPTKRGKHQLHVKINGKHIRGSPFLVVARLPVEKLGTPIRVINGFAHPWGVATTAKGEVVVTECNKHRVTMFKASGEEVRSFGGSAGCGKMQFFGPCGVAVDGAGHIYVADTGNHRIQKFTVEGQYIAVVGQKGRGPQEFIDPKDIAFNTVNNKLYVADSPRVQVLNSNLTFCSPIGTSARGQINNAFGVACDTAGNVYVSDNKNKNIQKFTADGRLLKTFNPNPTNWLGGILSGGGKNPLTLSTPLTIAVDNCGFMYVCDELTWKVYVLSPEGAVLASFGGEGGAVGQFRNPRMISVDDCGLVYVCDRNNGRVQVF